MLLLMKMWLVLQSYSGKSMGTKGGYECVCHISPQSMHWLLKTAQNQNMEFAALLEECNHESCDSSYMKNKCLFPISWQSIRLLLLNLNVDESESTNRLLHYNWHCRPLSNVSSTVKNVASFIPSIAARCYCCTFSRIQLFLNLGSI